MLKSDSDKPNQGGSQSNDQSSVSQDDDKIKDDQSISELTELDDSQSPDAMSDISSTPSLSDLHSNHMESDHSSSSLSDLFTNSINSLSWEIFRVTWCIGVKYRQVLLYCSLMKCIFYCNYTTWSRDQRGKMKILILLGYQIAMGWKTNTCHWSFFFFLFWIPIRQKRVRLISLSGGYSLTRTKRGTNSQDIFSHLETIEISSIQTNNMSLICTV